MAETPPPDPGGFRLAPISPLLADPEWIAGFKQAIQGFLDVARPIAESPTSQLSPLAGGSKATPRLCRAI